MKPDDFDKVVKFLGMPHLELLNAGLVSDGPFLKAYPEADDCFIEPENGICFTFSNEDMPFKGFYIRLKKTFPTDVEYEGELPEIFFRGMNQADVHDFFGMPVKFKLNVKLPEPVGLTGGWEDYVYDAELYPGVMLEFQYTADMEVDTIVFFRE